ncbi:MAG TPA: proline dehydrogenase family protein [Thermoanaerobaculia bacterium]|nr:proline dehydrogenase family protein [Thermoanaerobaculia bacterium]
MFRSIFIALSESKMLRAMAERSRVGRRVSSRFVAGMTVQDALTATAATNSHNMSVSVDNLGENVTNVEEAHHSAALYGEMLDQIAARKLNANVSLKLTHMGLDVDEKLSREIVSKLVQHAANIDNFVRVDMEGSAYTEKTLQVVRELHHRPGHAGHVGAVIQAYLFRSERDVEALCAERIRIRLCKGAYKEPPEIAFQKKEDVDANFVRLTRILLHSGTYHGIATHDPKMIDATIEFAHSAKIAPDRFEFQMLYGIRRDLQEKLVRDGWRMRVYIPFGTEWYPYLMRRLAERPANAIFILKNLLRR